jgi:hypothetical protein
LINFVLKRIHDRTRDFVEAINKHLEGNQAQYSRGQPKNNEDAKSSKRI